jgi:hypothetical protein
MRTSPPDGSTRPGAEAAQPDLVGVLGAAAVLAVEVLVAVDVLPVVVTGGFTTSEWRELKVFGT